jgi:hypothetical protein
MGCRYQFSCPACGYSAEVSGDDDAGMECCTTTIVCHDCKQLFDVQTGWSFPPEPRPAPKVRCPNSAQHTFTKWKAGDGCPRCGTTMENKDWTVLWD